MFRPCQTSSGAYGWNRCGAKCSAMPHTFEPTRLTIRLARANFPRWKKKTGSMRRVNWRLPWSTRCSQLPCGLPKMKQREPAPNDLAILAQALADFGVEYALIGGTAMAVHGFARATKDIDLLLPVDAENNARLLKALASIPGNADALAELRPEWMDKGHSTALEGQIFIDLLYVAAGLSFENLKAHVQTLMFNGIPVVTLDVDGMLLSKKTTRESDIPDRLKLERLRSALRARENPAKPKS